MDVLGIIVALIAAAAAAYFFDFFFFGGAASKSSSTDDDGNDDDAKENAEQQQREREAEAEKKKKATTQPNKKQTKSSGPKKAPRFYKPTAHPRYVRRFGGHHGNILSMCPSPNGEWMATSGADGLLRVARVERPSNGGPDIYLHTKIEDDDLVPDKVTALSWEADNRTVVCHLDRSSEVRFYRMRKKKDADPADHHPYELAELVKRRFNTSSKMGDVTACVADPSSTNFCLVLTSGDSNAHRGQKTVAAWDGKTGHALNELTTGGKGDVRLSDDGKFLCGRSAGKLDQIKLFECVKKKVKGDVEPQFDHIPPTKVMTLVANAKVADVSFGYKGAEDGGHSVCDKAFVCTVDGTVQVWNLDVEYRSREDPKLLCSVDVGKKIALVASSVEGDRAAVVTVDGALHILKYASDAPKGPAIEVECTVQSFHSAGVGDVQFCSSGKQVYTQGKAGKDIFAWSAV